MQRRDLLRAAAAAAALSLLPREAHALAERAWRRADAHAAGEGYAAVLTPAQRAVAEKLADTILPRTDTPGATDVGVIGFIEVIVADYYSADERTAFLTGLDAIDALATSMGGGPIATLSGDALARVMTALDTPATPADRAAPAARAYTRLKGLVVHGYFTSERVQKSVLRTNIMPGVYDGAAPMPVKATRAGSPPAEIQ